VNILVSLVGLSAGEAIANVATRHMRRGAWKYSWFPQDPTGELNASLHPAAGWRMQNSSYSLPHCFLSVSKIF